MCLYVTRRYVHTDGRIEIAAERDETVQVGSSSDYPDLISHDGASTVSSSMPATPISAISPAGPLPVRYASVNYEDRSPSTSPHGKVRRYRLSFNSDSRSSRQAKSNAPRPVVLQPTPPSTYGRGRRVELPEYLRTRQRRSLSDSENDDPFLAAPSVLDRRRAEEQYKREEKQRQRAEQEASLRHGQETYDHRSAEENEDEDEHKERMLDLQEQRTEKRMLGREHQREEARRRLKEEEQQQLNGQEAQQRIGSQVTGIEEYARDNEAPRRDTIEMDRMERLRRQIREGREREPQQRQEGEDQAQRERREQERQVYERQRQQLRQQLEEREPQERAPRLAQVESHTRERAREPSYQDQLESARRDYEELDRRLRAREYRAQIDGPRFGTRRSITAGQSPHLQSLLGRASPLDDADFRRSRGQEVLEEARRTASLWDDEEEEAEIDGPNVPLISRRNTIGGMNRSRETCYRQRMRRYPG